jgi:hypothetical protein
MSNENISDELDNLINKLKELGSQSEQFSKTRESLIDFIEKNKQLSEDYSNALNKCDGYIDKLITSFDDNVFNKVTEQIKKSKKIVDDCIQKNEHIKNELEQSHNLLKNTIDEFSQDNETRYNVIISKINTIGETLNFARIDILDVANEIKKIILSQNDILDVANEIKKIILSQNEIENSNNNKINNKIDSLSNDCKKNNDLLVSLQNECNLINNKIDDKAKRDKKKFIILVTLLSIELVIIIVSFIYNFIK